MKIGTKTYLYPPYKNLKKFLATLESTAPGGVEFILDRGTADLYLQTVLQSPLVWLSPPAGFALKVRIEDMDTATLVCSEMTVGTRKIAVGGLNPQHTHKVTITGPGSRKASILGSIVWSPRITVWLGQMSRSLQFDVGINWPHA